MRMMITGVCTALLALVNLIFGGQFAAGGDAGQKPVVYVILSVILLGVAVGVCYRTIGNGLKALFAFNANSDSAAAVAAVAVGVQTVLAAFFPTELADGTLHLYGVLLAAILFVNSAGKLCMIRRIHSNFRFVTSREQKYSVRLFDDYNTSRDGEVMDVLCEGWDDEQQLWFGRTYADSVEVDGHVYFESDAEPQAGEFVSVRITESLGPDLLGVQQKGE